MASVQARVMVLNAIDQEARRRGIVHPELREKASRLESEYARGLIRQEHSWLQVLPTGHAEVAERSMLRVECAFRFVALFLPKRLVDEEIGDAVEEISLQLQRSPARWPVYLKIVTTVFWVMVHAIGYLVSQLKGVRRASGE
ncbi:hypothetical protein WMF31_00730 [Sorangium sp. So ce1036]|uniref:hypothetical protein n=1 Tax=Sorangium sp. So ce1036 TaxID=3133328 RepID=UPI003F020A09